MSDVKQEEQLSVADFKKWLEGAEAFQPDDWCPNEMQWKAIRDKISLLSVSQPMPQQQQFQYRQAPQPLAPQQVQGMQNPDNIVLPSTPTPPRSQMRHMDSSSVGPSISIGDQPVVPKPYKKVDKNGQQS